MHLHKLPGSEEGDDGRREECDIWVENNNLELTHPLSTGRVTPVVTSVRVRRIHGS